MSYALYFTAQFLCLRLLFYWSAVLATQAAMKGVTPRQVKELGITLILNNTYHLSLRPGTDILDKTAGKHYQRLLYNLNLRSDC